MQFLRVSRQKNQKFFPCRGFLSCDVSECLSRCFLITRLVQYEKWKTMLRNLNYVQCLNIAPMKKALFRPQWNVSSWFISPMEYTLMVYSLNGIYPMGYSPNGKGMVLWKIVFRSGNSRGKSWKNHQKWYNVNQN